MSLDFFQLYLEIELKKQRLVLLAERYGRTSPIVIAFSQRLDKLINKYLTWGASYATSE